MDEPFAALDEITRLKLNDDLAALRSSLGATVVFVTHSVFESVYLSDRIVVMAARPGRAVAEINRRIPDRSRGRRGFGSARPTPTPASRPPKRSMSRWAIGRRTMLKGGAA